MKFLNLIKNKFSKKFIDIEKLNLWTKKGIKPYL